MPLECRGTRASPGWLIPREWGQSRTWQVVLRFASELLYSIFLGTEGTKWEEGAPITQMEVLCKKETSEAGEDVFSICNQDQVMSALYFSPILIYKFISIKCLREFYVHCHKLTKFIRGRKELKTTKRISKENKVRPCPTSYQNLP